MDQRIRLIRECSWEEVFSFWYESEGKNPDWAKLAKERGFASWADWRINGYARRFKCAEAEWGLYEVSNPAEVISSWFGGPFRTWISRHYDEQKTKSFAELAQRSSVTTLHTIQRMINDYPLSSVISALHLPDGRIFVIEGSHRACALALMAREGKSVPDSLVFAIGKSGLSELPPVGQETQPTRS